MQHSIEHAEKAGCFDRIVVSTNKADLGKLLPDRMNTYILQRPEQLCGPEARGYTYVQHALDYFQECDEEYNIFAVLPPTGPLRNPDDIVNCVNMLQLKQCDTVTSMVEVNHMFHGVKQKTISQDGWVRPFLVEENDKSTYQQLPKVYVRNCAIYASYTRVLNRKSLLGENVIGYTMPADRSIDINDPIDFEFAQFLYRKKERSHRT